MQNAKEPVLSLASVADTHLLSQGIRVERKNITFDLRENPRGQFLRITEEVAGHRNAIIIPLPGLEQFRDALNEVIKSSKSSTQDSGKPLNWFRKLTESPRTPNIEPQSPP